jgi:hypothetical protein
MRKRLVIIVLSTATLAGVISASAAPPGSRLALA